MCNLDVQPIFLGERTIREKLIIEAPVLLLNSSMISWRNLPLLSVTVTQLGPDLFPTEMEINYLNITIESIYKLPSSFTDSLEYKCGTIIYIDTEVTERIIFESGKWKKFHDIENKKQWKTLNNLKSRAKFSKYEISLDYENVKNCKNEIDLQKIVNLDIPRVEWNYVNRNLIRRSGVEIMQQFIEKYKYWPFQIIVCDKNFETGKTKDMKKQIYQCYVDLTELLYPGKTRVRVAAQLFTYNISEMIQKTGQNGDIFSMNLQESFDKSPNSDQNPSIPLTNDNGEPTIILIEFELNQPLKKSCSNQEYSEEIAKLIGKRKPHRPYILTSHLAEEQFSDCIKKLVEIITERYQNFIDKNKRKEDKEKRKNVNEKSTNSQNDEEKYDNSKHECYYHYIPDELQCFIQHLHNAGEYTDIRNTLKNKIITLLDQKFTSDIYSWDKKESQNYIAKAYVYLVERIHMVLNSTIENQLFTKKFESKELENFYFYAEEAYILGNIDEAKHYYVNIISNNSKNPNAWINYAIFLKKNSEIEKALQCCREAIALDNRHKIGLLMYGILLTSLHKYREAQLFLESLTAFYPRFAEAWIILHLFYQQIEYQPGLDVTINNAEKYFQDKTRDTDISLQFFNQPLAWSMNFCKETEMYIVTATLLMKLSLYEFAGLALAQELSLNGRTIPFLYYLSVDHFLRNQYESAIQHLKEIERNYGLNGFMLCAQRKL
ncbi:cilia- and flagella-associated protein 70-like isoform X2 [Leptopilina boulardi]|uniref:cilia- and flagella-associated protein 70-like isoform X2 n=1 Tax=Leptopilina boulardi TaxID=63433 RepID=UPI0021F66E03|nr:cilia- and flagella-associated protein 70-like isoform X2 [Leptopilina boulardi]